MALDKILSKILDFLFMKEQKTTVLVAEDDPALLGMLEESLHVMSFNVLVASTIRRALDYISSTDILILDLTLWNGDARIVLETWTSKGLKPALVITGAELAKGEKEDILLHGILLEKPFNIATFQAILHRYAAQVSNMRLASKVSGLARAVVVLIVVVALLAGKEFLPMLAALAQTSGLP